MNIASKLFGDKKPTEAEPKPEETVSSSSGKPSGFYSCSVHRDLPPMTIKEFDNHKTAHDISNSAQKSSNVQSWGVVGLWKNTSIRPCDLVPILEGDERLHLVETGPGINKYVVVREVIREVLVTCRHCGARYQQGTPKCLTCGANL